MQLSFSLSDSFVAAFSIYQDITQDDRAEKMIQLFRYGTNNMDHIYLMRYGFPPENVIEIAPYIHSINEENIRFKTEIEQAPDHIKKMVNWYLP